MNSHKQNKNDQAQKLAEQVERRARAIVEARDSATWESSPRGQITRELAIVLEELDRLRTLHARIENSLLESQCYVDTELMYTQEVPERHRLQAQLSSLRAEGRRFALTKYDQLRALTEHLLSLVNKHVYLTTDDDN